MLERVMGLTGGTGAMPPPARGTRKRYTVSFPLLAGTFPSSPIPQSSFQQKYPPIREDISVGAGNGTHRRHWGSAAASPGNSETIHCIVSAPRGDVPFESHSPIIISTKNIPPFGRIFLLERVMGLEPTISAWKANVLPLHYTRVLSCKWCGRRDLNSYAFRHWNLNPARLPIPPRPQASYSNLVTRRRFELRTP